MVEMNWNIVDNNEVRSSSWTDDIERLVLYADIMGFSHRVTKMEHKALKQRLLSFGQTWRDRLCSLQSAGDLRYVQFSDSILIVVNGVDERMFNLITKAAVCLMQSALSLDFPIKGVLAQGQFTFDEENELYFGLPLVEAYQLHDEIYYYGVVVHHSAERTVKQYMDSTKPYSKAEVYLKRGATSHYHLTWHLLKGDLTSGNIKEDANRWLDTIEESVSGTPRIYVDHTRNVVEKDEEWNGMLSEKGSLA